MPDPGLTSDSSAQEDPQENLQEPATEVIPDVVDDDYYDTDEPHRSWPKTTLSLLVGVLMAAAFTGGVLVQKKNDTGLTSSTTSAMPSGFPTGGAGGGAFPGGSPTAGTGAATSSAATSGPVLVGTVVSVSGSGAATKVTVKDLGGKKHVVTTTGTTTVTKQLQKKATGLAAGDTVSVDGKKATNGNVAATAFTIR